MKEGDLILIQKECMRKECEECGELAIIKHTFLLPNARINRGSKAFGKDDCSWCEDDAIFLCNECNGKKSRYQYARDKDMGWCSTFNYERMPHIFLYWKATKLDMPQKLEELT